MKIRLHPLFVPDGEFSAPAADTTIAPSVVAGTQEVPGSGNAPAPASTTIPAIDVTQQQSFADRLKEETGKIKTEYEPYKNHVSRVERIAKESGFSNVEEYLEALDTHVKAEKETERATAAANKLGVDMETYKQFFAPVHEELNNTKQEVQTLRNADLQRTIKAEHEQLKTQHSDFAAVESQVFDLAEKRGFSLTEAYKLVSFDNQVAAAKLAGQNDAIDKLNQNANSSPGAAGGDAPNQVFDFTKLSREQRSVMYEKAKRGELKSLN